MSTLENMDDTDRKSEKSHKSGRSQTSRTSSKTETAAEIAELEVKLKYVEIEAQKKAEMERLETQKQLEIAKARLSAIEQLEEEEDDDTIEYGAPSADSVLTQKPNVQEYVRNYVESVRDIHSEGNVIVTEAEIHHADTVPELPAATGTESDHISPDLQRHISSPTKLRQEREPPLKHDRNFRQNEFRRDRQSQFVSNELDHNAKEFVPRISMDERHMRSCVPQQSVDVASLTKSLAEQINLSRMPPPEPGIFTGDPISYPNWRIAFETLIERRTIPTSERIYYLKRYISGKARDAVEGYVLLSTDNAYEEAKALLDKRFGNPFVIGDAFRDKLESWPRIPARDGPALRCFTDFLRQCQMAMRTVNSLRILNDDRENQKILQKLPEWISYKWGRIVVEWRERRQEFPPFSEFVLFLTKEADIACDPVTSFLSTRSWKRSIDNDFNRRHIQGRSRSTSLSTGTTVAQTDRRQTGPPRKWCLLCKDSHDLDNCKQFLDKPIEERKEFAKSKGLCFGCLGYGHRSRFCSKRSRCKICFKLHPTSLHGDNRKTSEMNPNFEKDNTTQMAKEPPKEETKTSVALLCDQEHWDKCSMIVPVWVSHVASPEREMLVYALLDTQSDTTFIHENVYKALELTGHKVQLKLSTMTARDTIVDSSKVDGLVVRGFDSHVKITLPMVYSREIMPANLSHVPTPEKARQWPHLESIADQLMTFRDLEVGLLIGYNCPRALTPREVIAPISDNAPFGQRTDLGWGIVGIVSTDLEEACVDPIGSSHKVMTQRVHTELQVNRTKSLDINYPSQVHFSLATTIKETILPFEVARLMEQDFSSDSDESAAHSYEDKRFLRILNEGIHKCDNHYEMPLPFKNEKPVLPNNRPMAMYRLGKLKSKFENNANYWKDYVSFMNNVIENGHAEEVPLSEEQERDGSVWYIPHHGIYHAKKPDKIRVVFDCSARHRGVSLNDLLLKGPDLTNNLAGVLCRFRREQVGVMCDIEQMFHQFRVNPDDRNYLRFLWWNNGDFTGKVVEYRMCVHLFGAVSSPGCANFALKKTADDNEMEFGTKAANFVRHDFYVDDGLESTATAEEAVQLVRNSVGLCANGGLRLHKFVSNCEDVMNAIPPEDRAKGLKELNVPSDSLPVERALGVQWSIENDTFQFCIKMSDTPLTRRGILSTVSSIFDPLGFLAPVVLKGKLMLQELCKDAADWDAPIPDSLRRKWEQWRSELVLLDSLEIERCMKPADFGEVETAELHHFSDASMSGYGQCSFLRLVSKTEQVNCCFVMGKSRVAPLKLITVPRLELTAAVTSVRVSAYLKQELQLSVDSEWFWTDSQIVLGYIANDVRRFHVFVANRVQQIRDRSNPDQWKHVPGEHNPADDGSRGLNVKELKTSKWLHGPEFLWNIDLSSQMLQTKNFEVTSDDPEVKVIKHAKVFASVAQHSSQTFTCFLERFSDWHKIKRVVARCLKWRALGRSEISIEDMRSAEIAIVRAVQAESFSEEITVLKSLEVNEGSSIRSETCKKKKALKRKSSIFKLDPFLDSDGLLRVGGRLKQASFQEELVHPVILPKKHNLTRLIVQYFHARVKHQGRGMTVNEIRSNGYWIVGCCSLVAWFISKCVTCRKLRTRSQIQKMSDLPKVRCESVPPFTDCAVDLFGPFLIKEGRKELKRYGVIFTCMACRAIHLETANSMTTDSFISSLRRFLSLRGPIRTLHCDQGTNFIGAKNELFGKLKDMDQDAIQQYLQKEGCDYFDFRMNTPASSHMGGVWERLIRSVRSVLVTLMEESGVQLDDEGLRTMMCEVTAIVNCRPITTDTLYDATSLEALTPNHLLTMKPKILLQPSGSFKREDIYCRQRWKRVQYLMNQFWSRWRREYLQTLQVRQKWVHPQRDVQVGDIVLVKDDDLPRNQWMLGRVIETIKDSDEHVRKVKLMIGSCELDRMGKRGKALSVLERPIHKTVLLLESDDQ